MNRRMQVSGGYPEYLQQLDRARRFLDRVDRHIEDLEQIDSVEFQDMMWSFFQHCWHVKDWVKNDQALSPAQVAAVLAKACESASLIVCQDICNATKHLQLSRPRSGTGAGHRHVETIIEPERGRLEVDCIIYDGQGHTISGKQLGRDCIDEWERILQSEGLATARRS